jgi:hypothetical protein
MAQTKIGSFAEAWMNVAVGFSLNALANVVVLPIVGLPRPSFAQNMGIGVLMTFVSVGRSYALRRWFNNLKWSNK